jgi:phosphate transport system permease protein
VSFTVRVDLSLFGCWHNLIVGWEWNVTDKQFGALPLIYGTIGSSFISLTIAVPIELAVATVTSKYLLVHWWRSTIAFTIELTASLPAEDK